MSKNSGTQKWYFVRRKSGVKGRRQPSFAATKLLRKEREKIMTLRAFAQHTKISPGFLSELERGQKTCSEGAVAAICTALGTHGGGR